MKRLLMIVCVTFGCATVQAGNGEKNSTDTNQKVVHLTVPNVDLIITYCGGDTLSVLIDNQGAEDLHIRLMGDGVTLLHDKIGQRPSLNRVYIISAFPEGTYKIRMKKGNYVVEKEWTKLTPASTD